jgi:hypothetical protein
MHQALWPVVFSRHLISGLPKTSLLLIKQVTSETLPVLGILFRKPAGWGFLILAEREEGEQKALVKSKSKSKVTPLQARCGPEGGYRYSSTLP